MTNIRTDTHLESRTHFFNLADLKMLSVADIVSRMLAVRFSTESALFQRQQEIQRTHPKKYVITFENSHYYKSACPLLVLSGHAADLPYRNTINMRALV